MFGEAYEPPAHIQAAYQYERNHKWYGHQAEGCPLRPAEGSGGPAEGARPGDGRCERVAASVNRAPATVTGAKTWRSPRIGPILKR